MRLSKVKVAKLFQQGLTIGQVCEASGLKYNSHTRKVVVALRPPEVEAKRGRRKRPKKKKVYQKRNHRRTAVPAEIAELRDALVAQWAKPYDPDRLARLLAMLRAALDYHRKPSVDDVR